MSRTSDYVRVSMVAALVIVVGLAVVPLMQFVPAPVFKVVWIAPLYSMAAFVLLQRVSLPGTILFFGVLLGAILTMFMPYIFFVSVSGGLGAQLSGLLLKRLGFDPRAVSSARAALFPVFQLPLMYILVMPLNSANAWLLLAILTFVVCLTSLAGLVFGRAINRRLSTEMESRAEMGEDRHKAQ